MTVNELKKFKIVVRKNAGECELYSADNLYKYLKKTCGVSLKTVKDTDKFLPPFFSIGETAKFKEIKDGFDRATLINDGFRIFTENGNIFFDSLTVRGVMYAVYDFIENELGVRFLTASAEYIPSVKEIDLSNVNRVSIPDFEMRTYLMGDTFQATCNYDHLARTRVKDIYTEIPEKYGGPVPVYGRNITHNFHFYVPYDKYLNNHPEWYRFMKVNNELISTIDLTNGITDDGKLDESMNESVAKAVIEEMKKDMDKYPDVSTFMFTQEDGSYTCSNTRLDKFVEKYKWSGVLIRFTNVVIKELNKYAKEKGRADMKIMLFAYSYTSDAPVKNVGGKIVPIDETVVCDKNIVIQYALFANGAYHYFDERQEPVIKKRMTEWRAVAERFWFWAYDTDYFRYLTFYDSFHYIGENVRGFKNYGIEYMCMNGAAEAVGLWQNGVRSYAYRKLLWDSSLDADKLVDEFITLFYGVASGKVKEMIKLFHDHYQNLIKKGVKLTFITRGTCETAENNPVELLDKAISLMDEGEALINESKMSAKDKKEYLRRLAQVKCTPLMMRFDKFGEYFPDKTEEDRKKAGKLLEKYVAIGGVDWSGDHWNMNQYFDEKKEVGKISSMEENLKNLTIDHV